MLGATELSFTDAYFEAMSGLTTTGSTVITGLDNLPQGILLWRGLLQWLGGIGVIIVAMVFLPELRVGGMQIFKSEAFDTFGKILPRATAIARQISTIYIALTMACTLTYLALGMSVFDATVHALTTVSTGGFANYDSSFAVFSGLPEYAASFFMVLAALPFVRYVQMINGRTTPLLRDSQVQVFLMTIAALVTVSSVVLVTTFPHHWEQALRESLFNITSIITGTGYASVDYMGWGSFLVALFFFTGLIGGCAGSTTCSVKIFRYQILFSSIRTQIRRIRSPHGIFAPRFEGRTVGPDVMSSVISFFMFFVVSLGLVSWALAMTGLDMVTSVSGAATALANVGPGLGDIIGPAGNFQSLNDSAKWILSIAMLTGRLELLSGVAPPGSVGVGETAFDQIGVTAAMGGVDDQIPDGFAGPARAGVFAIVRRGPPLVGIARRRQQGGAGLAHLFGRRTAEQLGQVGNGRGGGQEAQGRNSGNNS